jgi:chromate reductase, NAD(P)H dehydrogenase (quinone)
MTQLIPARGTEGTEDTMKIIAISGSTRHGSLNTRLARLVAELRPADVVTVVSDLDRLPFYDADLEAAGAPDGVADLRTDVTAADVVVVVTPEYNGTVPGLLGNAVDWLSRPPRQSVLRGKPVLVLSASPTPYGGSRAAEHLRAALARLGATVLPTGLSVAAAHRRLAPAHPDPQVVADLADLLTETLDSAPQAISA